MLSPAAEKTRRVSVWLVQVLYCLMIYTCFPHDWENWKNHGKWDINLNIWFPSQLTTQVDSFFTLISVCWSLWRLSHERRTSAGERGVDTVFAARSMCRSNHTSPSQPAQASISRQRCLFLKSIYVNILFLLPRTNPITSATSFRSFSPETNGCANSVFEMQMRWR